MVVSTTRKTAIWTCFERCKFNDIILWSMNMSHYQIISYYVLCLNRIMKFPLKIPQRRKHTSLLFLLRILSLYKLLHWNVIRFSIYLFSSSLGLLKTKRCSRNGYFEPSNKRGDSYIFTHSYEYNIICHGCTGEAQESTWNAQYDKSFQLTFISIFGILSNRKINSKWGALWAAATSPHLIYIYHTSHITHHTHTHTHTKSIAMDHIAPAQNHYHMSRSSKMLHSTILLVGLLLGTFDLYFEIALRLDKIEYYASIVCNVVFSESFCVCVSVILENNL